MSITPTAEGVGVMGRRGVVGLGRRRLAGEGVVGTLKPSES